MNEERLIGYIKGDITSEKEIVEILDWIESSSENQKKYTELKNLWVVTSIDHSDQLDLPVFHFPKDRKSFNHKRLWISFSKYAAVFILAFTLGTFSLYLIHKSERKELSSLYNTIVVPYGERSQITLYDGTKVWLNSGTTFRYPVAFSPDTRDVSIEGEAYFEVAKNVEHPFVVSAGQLKIQVLGTRFNVCAYPDDMEFLTTLDEGSVQAINTIGGGSVKMKPGEQVILNRETAQMERLRVDTELYTSWKENLLKFENATFEEVVRKIERWYDVKVTIDQEINTQERYTMTIKTESLRELLQLISRTTKMKYEINKNIVIIKKP